MKAKPPKGTGKGGKGSGKKAGASSRAKKTPAAAVEKPKKTISRKQKLTVVTTPERVPDSRTSRLPDMTDGSPESIAPFRLLEEWEAFVAELEEMPEKEGDENVEEVLQYARFRVDFLKQERRLNPRMIMPFIDIFHVAESLFILESEPNVPASAKEYAVRAEGIIRQLRVAVEEPSSSPEMLARAIHNAEDLMEKAWEQVQWHGISPAND